MYDIDCHIIIHKAPQWKIDRCLASLEGQSVNLHLVKGEDEYPPYKGRARGFSMGSAPYVCYADHDDWVEPGAFELLNANLGSDLVYGWENVVREGKVLGIGKSIHHLFCLKRGLDLDYSKEWVDVLRKQHSLSTTKIDKVLYNWEVRGGPHGLG